MSVRYATYAPIQCPECGRVVELLRDGALRRHFPPGKAEDRKKRLCKGTHRHVMAGDPVILNRR